MSWHLEGTFLSPDKKHTFLEVNFDFIKNDFSQSRSGLLDFKDYCPEEETYQKDMIGDKPYMVTKYYYTIGDFEREKTYEENLLKGYQDMYNKLEVFHYSSDYYKLDDDGKKSFFQDVNNTTEMRDFYEDRIEKLNYIIGAMTVISHSSYKDGDDYILDPGCILCLEGNG